MRVGGGDRDFGADDLQLPELPEYVPSPKPPQTPAELVAFALMLVKRHEPNNPGEQARGMEIFAGSHLIGGRFETARLAYEAADKLHEQAVKKSGNPMDRALFLGRTAAVLTQYGQLVTADTFKQRYLQVMFS
jgi:hypothetical protein